MSNSPKISRRAFSRSVIGASAAIAALPTILRADPASTKLNLAFIGVGGRGGANLDEMIRDPNVNVVALCDVDARHLASASKRFPDARTFRDFRQLYAEFNNFDGVVVSTTEHTHAYATMPALRMGKHVYCEKPLTHNVAEARLITEVAANAGVATQMGTQIHGMPNYRRVVELIQSGAIGQVSEAHVWVSRAWGLQSKEEAEKHHDIVQVTERPTNEMTPPEFLDWELWLGPAANRPYHDVYFPGPKWYRWWDFGNGTMSDLGSHWNDLPFWALQLDAPTRIESLGDDPHPELAPASMTAVYQYGARRNRIPCTLSWYQGTHRPQIWLDGGIPQWDSAVLFVGERGMLLSDYGRHILLPEEEFKDFERPTPFIADSPGQHQEWLNACRTGSPTGSPFSYAGPLTEANHLGNVAFRVGSAINWDQKTASITNVPNADRFLKRTPKAGWSLES